ncbi:MAG: SGNH/GDSL hydrolase family protein [Pseudolabrys sp.]
MLGINLARRAMRRAAAAALFAPLLATPLLATLSFPLAARAEPPTPTCDTPLELTRLANPLPHFAQKLVTGGAITIVAIGSSSTAGSGASSPANSYPSQLALELKKRFPKNSITVINRGVGGEEVAQMLKRFESAVVAVKPDLVLWQLGTNSVIRNHKPVDHGAAIRDGINRIRSTGADAVLIDPQFAPKVIAKPEADHMVELIASTAKAADVDLFRRFDVMKHWYNDDHLKFETFVSRDGLHMNDWSYACLAKGLGQAIAEAAERPVMSARNIPHLLP